MMKPLVSIGSVAAVWIVFVCVSIAADEMPAPAAPILKVTYGEVWGPAPLMYSYSVWPSGEVRYEPLRLDYNGVKTRESKTIRTTPDKVFRAVDGLVKAGFLALQPEVPRVDVAREVEGIRLRHLVVTHSQEVTVEFSFGDEQFKIVIPELSVLPWTSPALRAVEKDLGISKLVR